MPMLGVFNGLMNRTSWDNAVRLAECSRCYIDHLDVDEWVANCKSTITSQQCGRQLDLSKDHGWSQAAVGLLDYILTDARACVDTVWHDQLIPIGLDHRCVHCLLLWRGVRPLDSTEQTIEFEKLDANFGYGWSSEFVPKFFAGNVRWKLNHLLRSAGTLSS